MKLLFKNRTKYSKKVYNEYLNFHRNKYNLSYKFYTIIVALLLFFCIGMQVKYHYYSLAILLCVIFTCFILWRLFRPVYEVKKEYQSKKIADEQTFIFKFYENCFVITNIPLSFALYSIFSFSPKYDQFRKTNGSSFLFPSLASSSRCNWLSRTISAHRFATA